MMQDAPSQKKHFIFRDVRLLGEVVRFFTVFGVVALGLFLVLQPLEFGLQSIESAHVQSFLSATGITTRPAQNAYTFFANEKMIEISPLCAGLLEFCLLIGAIVATRYVRIEKKIIGIIFGVVVLYLFNILRMGITILQLVHTNITFATFTHDVLFRAMLIVGFALVYGAWLNGGKIIKKFREKKWV